MVPGGSGCTFNAHRLHKHRVSPDLRKVTDRSATVARATLLCWEVAGAVEAGTPGFMAAALDGFVPFPDQVARPPAPTLGTGVDDLGVSLSDDLLSLLPGDVGLLDRALRRILENDEAVPLSPAVAMLLNVLATGVAPASLTGRLGSPFPRLSFDDTAAVFQRLGEAPTDLTGARPREVRDRPRRRARIGGGGRSPPAARGSGRCRPC